MFHYKEGTRLNFRELAEKHFEMLKGIRTNKRGETIFLNYSILKKIDTYSHLNGLRSNFFQDLKANNYKFAREIILAKPLEFGAIIKKINRSIRKQKYPQILDTNGRLTSFGNLVKSIFSYDTFSRPHKTWDAYKLANELGINVCPYCNRGYTFTVTSKGKGIIRPEFDHFYTQSKYPYLALSFYNLIPSCHICNSNLKHTKKVTTGSHVHPYEDALDKIVRFSVEFTKSKTPPGRPILDLGFFYGNLESFRLSVIPRKSLPNSLTRRAMNNIKTFRIIELYQKHKDLVSEMILNTIIYDESYINELLYDYKNLFRNRADVLRHITKNYTTLDQMSQRTFSKLTRDIHNEFGLSY